MLKSWSIENFKAIVNSGELKLAPVTILAGKNSSGKSSLIQSILMIAQTLSNQNRDLALLTNGDLTELRTFEDILSNYTQSSSIKIKFEVSDESESNKPYGRGTSTQIIAATFGSEGGRKTSLSAIEASKVVIEAVFAKFMFEYEGPTYNKNSENVEYDYVKDNLETNVRRISEKDIKLVLESVVAKRLRQNPAYIGFISRYGDFFSYTGDFLIVLTHFLPVDLIELSSENSYDLGFDILADSGHLAEGTTQITNFFTGRIRYLGPLRAKPGITAQGFSTKGNIDDVGIEGEFAASVYHANQNAEVDWYNPQTKQVEKGILKIALDSWVRHLSVAHQVTTEVAGPTGVTWKVVLIEGQKARTLPEVGVGISQILPILVMGLLSPKDSLLIMEQPELHLHPKVQAGLGDFFVGLAKSGKQCLIETHSENIVSQLRYHIVEAGGQDKSDCIIYFVDQDETGAAKFEPVEISPNGNILNWPDGFFDETMLQEDRITAASIKKRAKKAKNG